MTDQRLRDLERDAAHGDLQAQARLLLECVRVGALAEDRLRLAAYLEDEVACLAVGHESRHLAMDADWFRGLLPWSAALAVWALAEAATTERRPRREQLLDVVRTGLRAAFMAGTSVEFASSQHESDLMPLCYSAPGKVLVLVLQRLAQDRRQGRIDDPDVLRAIEEIGPRFSYLDAGQWTYAWSERARDGAWVHRLRYVRQTGAESMGTVPARADWQPNADAAAAGPDIFDDLTFAFSNPVVARAAVRAAILPWALAPRRSSK